MEAVTTVTMMTTAVMELTGRNYGENLRRYLVRNHRHQCNIMDRTYRKVDE